MPTEIGVPIRKVAVGAVTGSFITFVVLILNTYVPYFEAKPVSGELSAAATTFLTFVASYFTPPAQSETAVRDV